MLHGCSEYLGPRQRSLERTYTGPHSLPPHWTHCRHYKTIFASITPHKMDTFLPTSTVHHTTPSGRRDSSDRSMTCSQKFTKRLLKVIASELAPPLNTFYGECHLKHWKWRGGGQVTHTPNTLEPMQKSWPHSSKKTRHYEKNWCNTPSHSYNRRATGELTD